MFRRSRILPWIHLSLLLGERILALRAPAGGGHTSGGEAQSNGPPPERVKGGEVQSNGTPLERVRSGEVSSNAAPPGPVKSGCGAQKKDRCTWLLCKHEEYKTALERKKHESEVEAGVNFEMRDAPGEDRKRRSVEKRFLATKGTERLLYKAMIYFHKGKHCEWTLDWTKFEGWLETLFPSRSRCVEEVIRRFEPDEETCAEGFTNTFKKELNENCKDVDAINPYHAAEKAASNRAQVVLGMGTVLALYGAPFLIFSLGPGLPLIIAGLVLVTYAGLNSLTDLLCKRGKNWVRFINRRPKRVAV